MRGMGVLIMVEKGDGNGTKLLSTLNTILPYITMIVLGVSTFYANSSRQDLIEERALQLRERVNDVQSAVMRHIEPMPGEAPHPTAGLIRITRLQEKVDELSNEIKKLKERKP
jgi:hypothetical protein